MGSRDDGRAARRLPAKICVDPQASQGRADSSGEHRLWQASTRKRCGPVGCDRSLRGERCAAGDGDGRAANRSVQHLLIAHIDCVRPQMYARFAVDLDQKQNENVPLPVSNFTTRLLYEPKGVIACITPWNYPLLMALQKVSAAWAAGCAVVLKPSELAPVTCLLMGEIAQEAGIPAGALNIVPGLGSVTGKALAEHPGVDFISFTGSVRTGQAIMQAAAIAGPHQVSLELGGKSSMLVFDDVDVDATVR